MNITKICLLLSVGADELVLKTDLPDGCWPYKENTTVSMKVAKGTGETYIKTHFPNIPYSIICTQ